MPDFLDRFGDQLRAAQTRRAGSRSRRPRVVRRSVLLSVGLLAVAAPALAIVEPWNPTLGRPDIDDRSVQADTGPVSEAARDAFAVLRRPQSDEDRAKAAPLLRTLDPQSEGVQTDSIRTLGNGWALVPVRSMTTGPGPVLHDALCITDGEGMACGASSSVKNNGVQMRSATRTTTQLAGLVPDGVARVRFTPVTGSSLEASVTSNFYSLSVPQTQPRGLIPAPRDDSWNGPSKIEGPPMPAAGKLQWLADDGRVIGPAQP